MAYLDEVGLSVLRFVLVVSHWFVREVIRVGKLQSLIRAWDDVLALTMRVMMAFE
jgi:hypothetical protein